MLLFLVGGGGKVPRPGVDGGRGVPHPRSGMGGYPFQGWGTPVRSGWWGVPWVPPPSRPDLGTPHHLPWVPLTIQTWLGYPPPCRPVWGIPYPWDGVPPPPSKPGWGTPHPRPEMGYPPPSRPGLGTPHPRPEMGYPPTIQVWTGYPPPPASVDRLKILPSPILRMRAVTIVKRQSVCLSHFCSDCLVESAWGRMLWWHKQRVNKITPARWTGHELVEFKINKSCSFINILFMFLLNIQLYNTVFWN